MIIFINDELSNHNQQNVETLTRCVLIINESIFCIRKVGGINNDDIEHKILKENVHRVTVNCLWKYYELHKVDDLIEGVELGRIEMLRVLSSICMYGYDGAQKMVLSAFYQAALFNGKHRFECIVDCFKCENISLLECSMQFIMATLCNVAESKYDWQERILLRNEFLRHGLVDQLPVS